MHMATGESLSRHLRRWSGVIALVLVTASCRGIEVAGMKIDDKTYDDDGAYVAEPQVWPDPIYDAEEAIEVAVGSFPPDRNPHDAIARLVTGVELCQALQNYGCGDGDHPIWVVAIRGDGLIRDEAPFQEIDPELTSSAAISTTSIAGQFEGSFYMMSARSGDLISAGGLESAVWRANTSPDMWGVTYDDIEGLTSLPLTVEPMPTDDPDLPPPTIDPAAPPGFYEPTPWPVGSDPSLGGGERFTCTV